MAGTFKESRSHQDYTIACICPMGIELAPVEAILDEIHEPLPMKRQQNAYTFGNIGKHNVVIAIMPEIGNNAAATVATQLLNDFPHIRFGLLVGIGGGVPGDADIRLGDVVVSQATDTFSGVVQYDFGKRVEGSVFQRTGQLNKPPSVLSANVRKLQSQHQRQGNALTDHIAEMVQKNPNMRLTYARPSSGDRLFRETYPHLSGNLCDECDAEQTVDRPARSSSQPHIHYGTIGSSNVVLKDAVHREELRKQMNLLCVEMEAAGLMTDFPCIVIRGICDYADSHKNKAWQPYAAAVAAAYMKELLLIIPADQVSQPWNADKEQPKGVSRSLSSRATQRQVDSTVINQQLSIEHTSSMQNFNFVTRREHDYSFQKPVGMCLGHAPSIETELFIGREYELEEMKQMLRPDHDVQTQRRIILGGMGGIGKTQLAIAYAQRNSRHYDSVFWLNATTEGTVATSLQTVAECIFTARDYHALDPSQVPNYVRSWLSDPGNKRWLLIFDNHDEPQNFDIQGYYPNTMQGTIIVTTRRPDLVNGRQFPVRSLQSPDAGLRILATRSGRPDVMEDIHARRLADRLAGLPITLATAGTFLRKSTWSFQQYLRAYEERWIITTRTPLVLPEYKDRTMYTTWNMSYDLLKDEEPDAAKFLKILAYFDHQALWFELFRAGKDHEPPAWLSSMISDPVDFESIMHILIDYCFVEIHTTTQTFSIHTCVHDWMLDGLNKPPEPWRYWYAFHCVTDILRKEHDWGAFKYIRYASLTLHATRLMSEKFTDLRHGLAEKDFNNAVRVAHLLRAQGQPHLAGLMLNESLATMENVLGGNHRTTLRVVQQLGKLYREQGKLDEAEHIYKRAIAAKEQLLGLEHPSTLRAVHELGVLYRQRGKLEQAEQMYERALAGTAKALGPEHMWTLITVHELGNLYRVQGKLEEAEQMDNRALVGMEKVLGPDHTWTLTIVHELGSLYCAQGRLEKAEQMFHRALVGTEKAYGPEREETLKTVCAFGDLYYQQGRLANAEQMYERALLGLRKILGPEHSTMLYVIQMLIRLFRRQGNLEKAEEICKRALNDMDKVPGSSHNSTLYVISNLGSIYHDQGKSKEARQMYERALGGMEKTSGGDNRPTEATLKAFENLRLSMER